MTNPPEAVAHPTKYSVSCLPIDHPDAYMFTIHVVWRGKDRWAVKRSEFCYDAKGRERFEPNPSSRTDAFLRRYRHSFDDAMELAKRIAPTLTVYGRTAADVLGAP